MAAPCPPGRDEDNRASTRNSLVVPPLALAAPFDGSLVAAVVVTQTLVELLAELAYIRFVPRLWTSRAKSRTDRFDAGAPRPSNQPSKPRRSRDV